MTAGIDRQTIHCCDCGKNFAISGSIASDCIDAMMRCPYCGRNVRFVKECKKEI